MSELSEYGPLCGRGSLEDRFAGLVEHCARPEIVDEIARRCGFEPRHVGHLLDTYLNEAYVGLELVAPFVRPGLRVLEVGSGIGVLSQLLSTLDIDLVALEPGGPAFSFMPTVATVLAERGFDSRFQSLKLDVTALDPAHHGQFDLIFSVHVLEHLADVAAAFRSLAHVLRPGGRMVHLCPNYTFPYEPHLGLPLAPVFPQWSAHLLQHLDARQRDIWNSLNFITARQVKDLVSDNHLVVRFERGVMAAFMRRLQKDKVFAERHPTWLSNICRIMETLGLIRLIELVPPMLATPMVMHIELRK